MYGFGLRCSVVVDEAEVAITTEGYFVARQRFSAGENNTDESSFAAEPLLFVEPHEAGCEGVYCVIASHADLQTMFQLRTNTLKEDVKEKIYILARVEGRAALANDNVARYHSLVYGTR